MYTAVAVLHLIVCLLLIFIILVQSSKGAEMGAAFGGSNQTLFGTRGASTFLSKLTTGAAIVFMLTSLSLAIISANRSSVMSSVPAQAVPSQPLPDTSSGPLTETDQPSAPGQGEAKESTPQAAEKKAQ
jgi:preprotein translocase subunit SecG